MPSGTSASAREKLAELRERTHRYATLLVAELVLILTYPFFADLSPRSGLPRVLAVIVFSAALFAVLGKGRMTKIAFMLGIPAILLRLIAFAGHIPVLDLVDQVLGVMFMVFVTSVLVYTIVSDPSVTTDTLAGAVSAYFLIGITFGLLYALIGGVVPGAFRDTVEPARHLAPPEYTFYSFMTLTTVGYGDIVPRDGHARSFAMLESVIGIMYPAVLISRLVGLHGRKRETP